MGVVVMGYLDDGFRIDTVEVVDIDRLTRVLNATIKERWYQVSITHGERAPLPRSPEFNYVLRVVGDKETSKALFKAIFEWYLEFMRRNDVGYYSRSAGELTFHMSAERPR